MTLRLDLFDRRFDQLIEDGRARIPNLAPGWTDHNLHDPGITLMELLAWTAEAQMFALSRLRRDERTAYAALMGLAPRGPAPAAGQIWPAAAPARGRLVAPDAGITTGAPDSPVFWTGTPILLVPAEVGSVRTRLADGGMVEHTGANRLDGPGFQPFGDAAGPRVVLQLGLRCTHAHHLLEGASAADLATACLALGVQVVQAPQDREAPPLAAPLQVVLVAGGRRVRLPVAHDGSAGFLRSGVLLLGLGALALPAAPRIVECMLEISAPRGFARPPRILRIDANVLPVAQSMAVVREEYEGTGLPDQSHLLDQPGLQFGDGPAPVQVWSVSGQSCQRWELRSDLDASGPDDRHVVLDAAAGRVVFGNGVNGMAPAMDERLLVSYRASMGAAGNVPRDQTWYVEGVERQERGYGGNPDPMEGGADRPDMAELRRQARRAAVSLRVLVTAADLVDEALALDDLGVTRATLLAPRFTPRCAVQHGATCTLVAEGGGADAAQRRRWLDALHARLAPRLPLGTRLRVIGERPVPWRVSVRVVAEPKYDPDRIAADLRDYLVQKTGAQSGLSFGATVAPVTVAAWLSGQAGVARILACELAAGTDGFSAQAVAAPPDGVLQFDPDGSSFMVERAGRQP
jgi:hypothetical protein